MSTHYRRHCATICCVGLWCAATLLAGDLTPPAGPVAPTPGPEARIAINATNTPGDTNSVYKITAPGSYYLTENVATLTGKSGIEITASRVTIDLNGYEIREQFLQGTTLDGIVAAGALANITIRNGSIGVLNGDGIDLASARGCLIENISVRGVIGVGIRTGAEARVLNCSASECNSTGILTSSNCVLQSCTAELNGGAGFQLSFSNSARDCTANSNTLSGFSSGVGSSLINCTALANGAAGFSLGGGSRASDCTAYLNTGDGFSGIVGNVIDSCSSRGNGGDGFSINSNSMVSGCNAYGNGAHGYAIAGDQNHLVSNNATANIDRGFSIDGDTNWIDSNTATGNNVGFRFSGCDSYIVRNGAFRNATLGIEIVSICLPINPLNHFGVIVTRPSLAAGEPWANFDDSAP